MVLLEKSFPRGGSIPQYKSRIGKPMVFGVLQKKFKKQRQHTNKVSKETEQLVKLKSPSANILTLDTIQEGMLLMGIVKSINQLFVKVSLPGCITATVSALDISEAYTKLMNLAVENPVMAKDYKPLTKLFHVGQIIYGKVTEMKRCDTGRVIVNMSLKPADIHSELNYMKIQKGFAFNGAITEIQDHGYIIESGVHGVRCFLPLNKSLSEHTIGELIHLQVFHVSSDKSAAICKCKEVSIDEFQLNKQFGLDCLIPSTIVQFKVIKHLKNGLEGLILSENLTAYVNEHHLTTPLTLAKEIKINSTYNARIMYIMPLTKMIYLNLNVLNAQHCSILLKSRLNRGDIIENAKVQHIDTGGIILILNDNFKGILSFKTIKTNYKGNYDTDQVLAKYVKDSKHKVRITGYSEMDVLYTCSDDVSTVNEKYFNIEDLKLGDFVKGVVEAPQNKVGGFLIRLGKLKGIIEKFYLAPKLLEVNTKIKCRVIDINIERKIVYLTNRKEYMAKDCSLLTSREMAEIDHSYMGTVVNVSYSSYILVKFLGNVKGVLFKEVGKPSSTNLMEGQTMMFRIKEKKEEQLILDFLYTQFELGDVCKATFVNRLENALEISVSGSKGSSQNSIKAIVPIRLISDFSDLLHAKMLMYAFDDQLQAVCISDNIFSLRDVKYFSGRKMLEWNDIQIGNILRAFVKNVDDDIIELMLPVRGYDKIVRLHSNMMLMNAYDMQNITLTPEQVLYVKILGKNNVTKTLSVSAKLTDVWEGVLSTTGNYCESYLNEIEEVKTGFRKCGHPIADYSCGQKVMARFRCVNEFTNDWEYTISKTKVTGIVKQWMVAKMKPPEKNLKQECIVIWVDYSNAIVYLSNVDSDREHVSDKKTICENLVEKTGINAKVLFKNDTIFICSLKKGNNPLIICPTRLYYNDLENIASGTIVEGDFCELAFIYGNKPVAVLNSVYTLWHNNRKRKFAEKEDELINEKRIKTNPTKPKPLLGVAKLEATAHTSVKKQKTEAKTNLRSKTTKESENHVKTKEQRLYVCDKTGDSEIVKNYHKNAPTNEVELLPGIAGFWDGNISAPNDCEENSDEDVDDEVAEGAEHAVKKKLSAVERFKLQRIEEARLRDIEEKNADPNNIPNTVDQFDRLVLAEPNSSKHWISYMVYHLQSTEVDKARAVARRALKTISFRNDDDQLNIWVAMLNLELRYGTKSSFDDTLKEALTLNDPLKVYLRTIDILTEARKTEELLALIGVVTKKLKLEQQMWRSVANALFAIGMIERAQQLLHKALSCLPEREHVNTIVMFAALNHQYGKTEMGQTLLDEVVTSYPKRVDVWSQYVDMLVKDDLIDSARNVLERAVIQKLPLKKMRVLFKKYLEFEERFGTDANVQRVKALAVDYVKKVAKI